VRGPLDVVSDPAAGVLDWDLARAAVAALDLERGAGRRHAERLPWEESCAAFLSHLAPTTVTKATRDVSETATTSSYLRTADPMGRAQEERA
jgi:hypothetical protein